MSYVRASEVRKNHLVVFDMGYCNHSHDETCVVISIKYEPNLFGIPVYRFKVRRPGGEVIDVIDRLPTDKVEIL